MNYETVPRDLKCIPLFVSVLKVGVNNPAGVQSVIAINWLLLILTDSPEVPRKLTTAGIVKICRNEDTATSKRFDGNWGNLYTWDLPH